MYKNLRGKITKVMCALLTGVMVVGFSPISAFAGKNVQVFITVGHNEEHPDHSSIGIYHKKGQKTEFKAPRDEKVSFSASSSFTGSYSADMYDAAKKRGYVKSKSRTIKKGDKFTVSSSESEGRYHVCGRNYGGEISATVYVDGKQVDSSGISWMPKDYISLVVTKY